MPQVDLLTLFWTVGTGIGTIAMAVLVYYAYQDRQAIRALRRPGIDVARVMADGEFTDQLVRLVAVGALFLAGMLALDHIRDEVVTMLIVSAAAQVFLGTIKLQRRRRIFRGIHVARRGKVGGNDGDT